MSRIKSLTNFLLFPGVTESTPLNIKGRILFLNSLFGLCLVVVPPFIFFSLWREHVELANILLVFMFLQTSGVVIIRTVKQYRLAGLISAGSIVLLMLYLSFTGGYKFYSPVFIFFLPVSVLFLTEFKLGITINFITFLLVGLFLFVPPILNTNSIIPVDFSIRLFTSYFIVNIVAILGGYIHLSARKRLKYLAFYDQLTGLPNRASLDRELDRAIDEADKNNTIIAALLININRFKHINDSLSHQIGDEVLKIIVIRIQNILPNNAVFGRYTGADFLIFISDIENPAEIHKVAQDIHNTFLRPVYIDTHYLKLAIRIAITYYPLDGQTASRIMKNLDLTLNQARIGDKDHVTLHYKEEQYKNFLEEYQIAVQLRTAIKSNEFHLVYQPITSNETGRTESVEVLIRWTNSKLGLISPMKFIPIAEEVGVIYELSEWLFKRAFEDLLKLNEKGFKELHLSLNLSPVHMRNANFLSSLKRSVASFDFDYNRIHFEITEGVLLEDDTSIRNVIYKLKQMGFKLSLDDFGTGYSSLSYLKKFQVDCLKIDQSFIRQLKSEDSSIEIVKAIIVMAKSLNLQTIAEGVEYEEQLNQLKSLGCNYTQGYYYSKPLPFDELVTYLQNEEKRRILS